MLESAPQYWGSMAGAAGRVFLRFQITVKFICLTAPVYNPLQVSLSRGMCSGAKHISRNGLLQDT